MFFFTLDGFLGCFPEECYRVVIRKIKLRTHITDFSELVVSMNRFILI